MVSQTNKRKEGERKPSYAAIRRGKKIVDLMESLIFTAPATVIGGKREGAGRPPATDKATLLITIKATPAQKAKFLELGGSRWVKRLLNEAIELKDER